MNHNDLKEIAEDSLLNELFELTQMEYDGALTESEKERYLEIVEYCKENDIDIPFGIEV